MGSGGRGERMCRDELGHIVAIQVLKENYRTLHGQYQKKRCTLNFIKYTLEQTVLNCNTKSALLYE